MMHDETRLLDLLAARATEGLAETEERELERLLAAQTTFSEDDFEIAAAQIVLAFEAVGADSEPIPEHLKRRIAAAARSNLATPPRAARTERTGAWVQWTGWAAAAAVLLLLMLVPRDARTDARTSRERLIAKAADLVRVEWAPPEFPEYATVKGDVVWSTDRQEGYMLFEGLPPNDPAVAQYQLWIVDPTRDARPIDGGVFDVGADGRAVVPVDAKLRVNAPQAFAVTLEQPGGVVVSDGPLLVVAPVSG